MAVSDQIRKFRVAQNLTQIELAQKAGIAVNTLRLYEGGKRHPQPKQILLLAKALNIPVHALTDSEESRDMVQPVSARFYPTEDGSAILCSTMLDGSVYITPHSPITPYTEDIPWRISKEDADIIEILVDAYSNKRPKRPFPPEIGAGIKMMLDLLASKNEFLAESSSEESQPDADNK